MFERLRARMKQAKGKTRKQFGKKADKPSETIGGYKDEAIGKAKERYEVEKAKRETPPPPQL